jgi:hypothetical protein
MTHGRPPSLLRLVLVVWVYETVSASPSQSTRLCSGEVTVAHIISAVHVNHLGVVTVSVVPRLASVVNLGTAVQTYVEASVFRSVHLYQTLWMK